MFWRNGWVERAARRVGGLGHRGTSSAEPGLRLVQRLNLALFVQAGQDGNVGSFLQGREPSEAILQAEVESAAGGVHAGAVGAVVIVEDVFEGGVGVESFA